MNLLLRGVYSPVISEATCYQYLASASRTNKKFYVPQQDLSSEHNIHERWALA